MTITNPGPWTTFTQQAAQDQPTAWQQAPQDQAAAWQQAPQHQAPQHQAFQQYPPTQVFPPQNPPFPGFAAPPRPNRMPLIISLIVAAVVLIGGGVTTFLLLNKKDNGGSAGGNTVVPTAPASPTIGQPNTTTNSAAPVTSDDPVEPTTNNPTTNNPTTTNAPVTNDNPANDDPTTGGGDQATAQALAEVWVSMLNEGDIESASALICEGQRAEFVTSFEGQSMQNEIVVVSVEPSGENMVLTIGAAQDPEGTSAQMMMWPTNTGYFLICDNPLSQNDLNW